MSNSTLGWGFATQEREKNGVEKNNDWVLTTKKRRKERKKEPPTRSSDSVGYSPHRKRVKEKEKKDIHF